MSVLDNDPFAPEELDDMLKEYLDMDSGPFPMLQHPLVYSVPYTPQMNKMLNAQLRTKLEACTKAEQSGNYEQLVFLQERPYRVNKLVGVSGLIDDDKRFWELFASVYVDTENLWQNVELWHFLIQSEDYRQCKEYAMDEEERAAFEKLPDELTVYRGYVHDESMLSYAWTLDKERAEWFANRFGNQGQVVTGTVNKKDVFAYFTGRGEEEIVIFNAEEDVKVVDTVYTNM